MSKSHQTALPPEIHGTLRKLRRRIRRYILLEGTALIVTILGLLFWTSLALDWAYFQLSHFELPKWFRMAFDVSVVGLFAFLSLSWIVLSLIRSYREKALALVLERRFPELNDRLITAVELAESKPDPNNPLMFSMLRQTVDDVARLTSQLDLSDVFDKQPLRRALVCATVLGASIGGFAYANSPALERWKNGYLDLQDEYWQREHGLRVRIVTQPNDVIRDFRDHQYKHPRGGDLTLLVDVEPGKKVPERVDLYYDMLDGRGSGRVTCSKIGDRQFRHSFGTLLDGIELRVSGGDFTSRNAYRVIVVDPPRVERIELLCRYPAYTGLNPPPPEGDPPANDISARDTVLVQGTQVSLPMETEFWMRVTTNKALVSSRLQFGPYDLTLGDLADESAITTDATDDTNRESPRTFQARWTVRTEEGTPEDSREIPLDIAKRYFAADRRSFTVPLVLSPEDAQAARQRIEELQGTYGKPFLLPPDTLLRIYLEDTDEIIGSDPANLTINGIADQPPLIETGLKGIGMSITRKAVIPVTGTVTDDYGIAESVFEFKVDKEEQWSTQKLRRPPVGEPREFELRLSPTWNFERFAVLERELAIGQELTLTLSARDADNLNGPHIARGERFVFKVVSEEELLSILYQKELNIRRRFEQIISELEETQRDLILHRARAQEAATLRAEEAESSDATRANRLRDMTAAIAASAERALNTIQKNANETAAVEGSFRDIREELVNNAIHTPQILERIDGRIVGPLTAINRNDFPEADRALGLFRLANEKGSPPLPLIDASTEKVSILLNHMQSILLEMKKLETFQEAVELLKAIIDEQQKLLDETKAERKRELIRKLDLN